MFEGSAVALVTPFDTQLNVDEQALRNLVEWHIAEGTDVLVPCGTTGESATLNYEEHDRVIRVVVEQARGRVKVLAGTGSNATSEAIEMTRHARENGADGSLQVAPYYNKPTQEGLYRHFKTIAEAVDLPMVLYNVPGRTSVNMLPETAARLAPIRNIVGIKEASGNLEQVRKTVALCHAVRADFEILSGEDAQNFEILELGGVGMISVTANVVPGQLARLWDLYREGRKAEAEALHRRLQPLHAAMFFETNPIPVKTALGWLGRCAPELRLPLCEMGEPARGRLQTAMKEAGVL